MSEGKKDEKTRTEEFRINGDEIINKIRNILHQGNVRRPGFQTDHRR